MAYSNTAEQLEVASSVSVSDEFQILTDIYNEHVNIAIWQHTLSSDILKESQYIIENASSLQEVIAAEPEHAFEQLSSSHRALKASPALCDHIAVLVDMFCTLFEAKRAGVRLSLLDKAMCPKFHVDKIPCRLVTTFEGVATEWLLNEHVDRSKLGAGSQGLDDEQSDIMTVQNAIQTLEAGDVALLKGEGWAGNEGKGLVHRSPGLPEGKKRLLLTLDLID